MESSVLTPGQSQLLGAVAQIPYLKKHFYFTGGTALSAVYFHHRLSADLDFFTSTPLNPRQLSLAVKQLMTSIKPDSVEYQTLTGQYIYYFTLDQERLKVDLAYFPFEPLGHFKHFKNLNCSSLEDLAVNKLQAISTQSRSRDYVDLYVILTHTDLELTDLLQQYRLKFDVTLPPEELAKNLTKVLDAQDQPRFLGNLSWAKVEAFCLSQAKSLTSLTLKP